MYTLATDISQRMHTLLARMYIKLSLFYDFLQSVSKNVKSKLTHLRPCPTDLPLYFPKCSSSGLNKPRASQPSALEDGACSLGGVEGITMENCAHSTRRKRAVLTWSPYNYSLQYWVLTIPKEVEEGAPRLVQGLNANLRFWSNILNGQFTNLFCYDHYKLSKNKLSPKMKIYISPSLCAQVGAIWHGRVRA